MLEASFKICPACQAQSEPTSAFCANCGAGLGQVDVNHGDPLLDRTIAGKYRLVALIGEGAMGRVYKVEQLTLHKPFAIKILAPRLVHDPGSQERFAAEAHNAASLNHPNCVSVVDFGSTTDGITYIVMEYVRGRTLEQLIHEDHPLSRDRVVDLTLQLLAALSEAHGLQILHRDLKPENILVQSLRTHGELAKVVDFGIAKLMDGTADDVGLTKQGLVCGTPEYMSPEQARGQQLDARSDLYSVGCIFYQLLTGRPPFESDSAIEVLHRHVHEPPVRPSRLLGTVPDRLEDVCMQALSKEPQKRFASALEFRDALVQAKAAASAPSQATACGSCGTGMDAGDRFCAACGAPASLADAARTIPSAARKPAESRVTRSMARSDGEPTAEVIIRNFPLPLAGREAMLEPAREQLMHPRPGVHVQVLAGLPGAGKTRLVDELASIAEPQGWRIAYVGADPTGAKTPLWPIRLMVAQLLGLDPRTATTTDLGRAANLSGVAFEELPGLAELFLLEGPATGMEFQVRRRECHASSARALLSAGLGRPTLMIFEDIDAYDTPSRQILQRVVRGTSEIPIWVLCTTTEEETEWLGARAQPLPPLGPEAIRQVCDQVILGIRSSALPDALAASGPSSPLRLELHVRLAAHDQPMAVEASDDQLVDALLQALPAGQRRIMELASVLGQRFPEDDLQALLASHANLPDPDDALGDLHAAGLLLALGQRERAFSHGLLQQVAHRRLPPDDRREFHQWVADHAHLARTSVSVRALHLLGAGTPQAVPALEHAALAAERGFDDKTAAEYIDKALSACPLLTDEPERSAAQIRLVELLARVARDEAGIAGARALIERELARDWRPDALAVLHGARGDLCIRGGRPDQAAEALQTALGQAIATGDRGRMLRVYGLLGRVYVRQGAWKRAIEELREGLDMCTMGEGPRADIGLGLWRYLVGMSETLRAAGEHHEALRWSGHALEQAERHGDRLGALRCHGQMAWVLRDLDQRLLAEQHLARALEHARHFGDRLTTAELLIERARIRAAQGKLADARRWYEEALRLARVVQWATGIRHAERALALLQHAATG